jgi:hypothetical protein
VLSSSGSTEVNLYSPTAAGPSKPAPVATAAAAAFKDAVQLLNDVDCATAAAAAAAPGDVAASAGPLQVSPASHTPLPHAPARVSPSTRDARVVAVQVVNLKAKT